MRTFIGLLGGLMLPLAGFAEEKPAALSLHCHETVRVQMTTNKDIVRVEMQDDRVVRAPSQLNTASVALTGLAVGKTRVTLTDAAGAKERFEVTVHKPRQLSVTVGQTVRLQMSTRQPIKTVFNEKPAIIQVTAVPGDPTMVQVTGVAPGIARITLVDGNGREEVHEAGPP